MQAVLPSRGDTPRRKTASVAASEMHRFTRMVRGNGRRCLRGCAKKNEFYKKINSWQQVANWKSSVLWQIWWLTGSLKPCMDYNVFLKLKKENESRYIGQGWSIHSRHINFMSSLPQIQHNTDETLYDLRTGRNSLLATVWKNPDTKKCTNATTTMSLTSVAAAGLDHVKKTGEIL